MASKSVADWTVEDVLNIGRSYASQTGGSFNEAAARKYYLEEDRRIINTGFGWTAKNELLRTLNEPGHITNPRRFVSAAPPPSPPPPAPTPAAPPPLAPPPAAPAVDATREAAKSAVGKQSTLLTQVSPPSRARTKSRQKAAMQRSQMGLSSTTKQTLLGTA